MNPPTAERFQMELWETQCILYWILGFLLVHFGTWTIAHVFGWIAIVWGIVTMFVAFYKLAALKKGEEELNTIFRDARSSAMGPRRGWDLGKEEK